MVAPRWYSSQQPASIMHLHAFSYPQWTHGVFLPVLQQGVAFTPEAQQAITPSHNTEPLLCYMPDTLMMTGGVLPDTILDFVVRVTLWQLDCQCTVLL